MLLQWRVEGEKNTETAIEGVREEIFGRRDGEWRTRARYMGSGGWRCRRYLNGISDEEEGGKKIDDQYRCQPHTVLQG